MLREFTHCLQTKPHAHGSTVEECTYVDVRDVLQFQSGDSFPPKYLDAPVQATYGHLVPDSEDYLPGLLDQFDSVGVAPLGR